MIALDCNRKTDVHACGVGVCVCVCVCVYCTSFSDSVLFCLRRKSKSCPSICSSTVQNLRTSHVTSKTCHMTITYELESISNTSNSCTMFCTRGGGLLRGRVCD